jgi:cobalt/nickel transport system permease protein
VAFFIFIREDLIMHMADALLSPAVGTTFWAGSLGVIAYCARKLKQNLDDKLIPLMGIIGAFIFAAQMINFTIPGTGSSGHIGGGMILAILLGPFAGFITISSVLIIQSLFFADGGILALGCNIWNLGIYPCFVAYPLIFRPLMRSDSSRNRIAIASVVSVMFALQLGAFSVVIETLLSGRTDLPFGTFSAMMLPVHLAIGLIEGLITAGVVNYVKSARPEILESTLTSSPIAPGISLKNLLITICLAAFITGGVLSWFASTHPDGLEWAIEKVSGNPELTATENTITPAFDKIQDKTAILPDYDFRAEGSDEETAVHEHWPAVNRGTSLSGILGSFMVLIMVFLIGFGIRSGKKIMAKS